MTKPCHLARSALITFAGFFAAAAFAAPAATVPSTGTLSGASPASGSEPGRPAAKPAPDLSGRKRIGVASFYASKFGGRKMADGTPMDLHGSNAASRTLPLGTIAIVTNPATGRSAIITIRDRGPYVKGRIVDLSPATASEIGITRRIGVAKVEVDPIFLPLVTARQVASPARTTVSNQFAK